MDRETILVIVMAAFLLLLFLVAVVSDAAAAGTVPVALRGEDPLRAGIAGQFSVPTDEHGGE